MQVLVKKKKKTYWLACILGSLLSTAIDWIPPGAAEKRPVVLLPSSNGCPLTTCSVSSKGSWEYLAEALSWPTNGWRSLNGVSFESLY